jgi:hypothetical protein
MVNVKVTLLDGKHHPVDSSELAFEQAGSLGFQEAVAHAKPVFMEPLMHLQVVTPDDFLGAVTGDLNSRRAEITGMELRHGTRVIEAKVPLAELFGYTRERTRRRSVAEHREQREHPPRGASPPPARRKVGAGGAARSERPSLHAARFVSRRCGGLRAADRIQR